VNNSDSKQVQPEVEEFDSSEIFSDSEPKSWKSERKSNKPIDIHSSTINKISNNNDLNSLSRDVSPKSIEVLSSINCNDVLCNDPAKEDKLPEEDVQSENSGWRSPQHQGTLHN